MSSAFVFLESHHVLFFPTVDDTFRIKKDDLEAVYIRTPS